VEQTPEWIREEASTGTAEPDPLDIFGDVSLVGSPEWPDETYPKVIDEFARDTASRLGVDIGMVALPAIVSCAALTPDEIQVQPTTFDTEWRESARL